MSPFDASRFDVASKEPLRTMAVQGVEDVYASVSPGFCSPVVQVTVDGAPPRLGAASDESLSTLHPAWDEPEMLKHLPE